MQPNGVHTLVVSAYCAVALSHHGGPTRELVEAQVHHAAFHAADRHHGVLAETEARDRQQRSTWERRHETNAVTHTRDIRQVMALKLFLKF